MKAFFNNVFKNYFLMMLSIFATEIIFRVVVTSVVPAIDLPLLDWSLLRIFVGVNIIALLLGALFSIGGRITGNIFSFLASLLFSIYAIAQAGFVKYLGVFMSIGANSQAGAVADYVKDYFESFSPKFYFMLIPPLLVLLFYIFVDGRIKVLERNDTIDFADKFDSVERKQTNEILLSKKKRKKLVNARINAIVLAGILSIFYYYSLSASFMQNDLQLKPTKNLFFNPDLPSVAVGQFGSSMYGLIDLKTTFFPSKLGVEDKLEEFEKVDQVKTDYSREIDDTVWKKVMDEETNNDYKKLNNYYITRNITDMNDLTGFFKGKNLIVMMMESSSPIALDPKYYPNLSKLYNEGWAWENAYSPRNACSTGNNEMSGMVSLYTINNSCTANVYKNNIYPESIFNLFNRNGYTTTSYHNYTDQYYYRKIIHKNMGSTFYGVKDLGIPYVNIYQEWPSDIELVDKVLEKIEDQDKFMVWMTTVTAHQPYGISSKIGDKYRNLFDDTNYSISLKRYMSKLKDTDLAIGELMDGLKKQGKLDDTVIVLFADHYPYGLKDQYYQYFDHKLDSQINDVDRTPFVIYNPAIKHQVFKEYTTFVNITPTMANLFGFEHDPRLYAGEDLFSKTYDSRVIFADGSWKDDIAFYNAVSGKVIYNTPNKHYTAEEIREINNRVRNKIEMSNLAIKTDYFNNLDKKISEHNVKENTKENK